MLPFSCKGSFSLEESPRLFPLIMFSNPPSLPLFFFSCRKVYGFDSEGRHWSEFFLSRDKSQRSPSLKCLRPRTPPSERILFLFFSPLAPVFLRRSTGFPKSPFRETKKGPPKFRNPKLTRASRRFFPPFSILSSAFQCNLSPSFSRGDDASRMDGVSLRPFLPQRP